MRFGKGVGIRGLRNLFANLDMQIRLGIIFLANGTEAFVSFHGSLFVFSFPAPSPLFLSPTSSRNEKHTHLPLLEKRPPRSANASPLYHSIPVPVFPPPLPRQQHPLLTSLLTPTLLFAQVIVSDRLVWHWILWGGCLLVVMLRGKFGWRDSGYGDEIAERFMENRGIGC